MNFLNQIFHHENISVEFKRIQNIKPIIIEIYIKENNQLISVYGREFKAVINPYHYNHFMKKFIEDVSYRKQYLKQGFPSWERTVPFKDSRGINTQCKNMIDELNKKSTLKFKELANLKTFGRDSISLLNDEQLINSVDNEIYSYVKEQLNSQSSIFQCLRWIARGLNVNHSIHKVNVDLEIEENKTKYSTISG